MLNIFSNNKKFFADICYIRSRNRHVQNIWLI